MSRNLFVTGFGPFGNTVKNPSAVLAAASGAPFRELEVSWQAVDEWLESGEPDGYDALLHLGFADRDAMTPELFARNAIGKTADVRGAHRTGPIEPTGPDVVASTLWTLPLLASQLGPHLRLSDNAGEYLCNYIGYRGLRRFPEKAIGFLHVPSFEQVTESEQLAMLRRLIEALRG